MTSPGNLIKSLLKPVTLLFVLLFGAAAHSENCLKAAPPLPLVIEKEQCLILEGQDEVNALKIEGRLIVPLGSALTVTHLELTGQLTVRGELAISPGGYAAAAGTGTLENLGRLTQFENSGLQLSGESSMQSSGTWYVKDAQIVLVGQSSLKNSSVLELDNSTLALKDASLANRGTLTLKGQARLSNAGKVENTGNLEVLQLSLLALKEGGTLTNGRKITLQGSCTLEKQSTLLNQGQFEGLPHSLVYTEDEAQIINKRHFTLLGQLNLSGKSRLVNSADLHCRKSCEMSLYDQSVMINEGTVSLEGQLYEKGIKGGFFNRNIFYDRR